MKNKKRIIFILCLPVLLFPNWGQAQGIEITSGGSIACSGAATIEIVNGGFINNGTYTKATETVTFSGTTAKTISGTSNTIVNDVIISNTGGITTQLGLLTSNNLTIALGSKFIIDPGKAVTVIGTATNNASGIGLELKASDSGTSSLIANSLSGSGSANAESWLANGKWTIISSPAPGGTVANFLSVNTAIPEKDLVHRGMMDYNSVLNKWNSFFTDGSTSGNLTKGKGFALRVGETSTNVAYTGVPVAGDQTISSLISESWNCIGNPYTSAIHINSDSNDPDNFLTLNGVTNLNIDPAYGVYIWEKPDASNTQANQYTTISNVPPAFQLQRGQGFFVKMKTGATSVDFTSAMQTHLPSLALKSAESQWPTIQLQAEINGLKSSTIIAFNENMTLGLDPTYDAGLLKGNSEMAVFTRLVVDYGIPFAIQALPNHDFANLVIPVGLDSKSGGEVIFSANTINLPSECEVILEDRLVNKFTNLSENEYPVTVDANATISDRFYIHTSYTTTGVNLQGNSSFNLNAYAVGNTEIKIEGSVSENAVATLFDLQGRTLFTKKLCAGYLNVLPATNIKDGIYILKVMDNNRSYGFKIPFKQ